MKTAMKPTLSKRARTFRLVLLLAGVLLAMPQMALAQSVWTSPFDPAPEEEQEETTPWGAPGENPTYSNPWANDEADDNPWGHNPWDTSYDDPWDTSSDRSGGSDWSSDFYDFDDESSGDGSGSARRVGNGPAMANSVECTGDGPSGGCDNGEKCCVRADGTTFCNQSACNSSNAPPNDGNVDDPDSADPIPVDGALLYLLIAGFGYGAYKLRGF